MLYSKGDRVRYLGKPEWGAGLILRNSNDGKARILFEKAGVKTLVIKYAKLMKVQTKRSRELGLPPLS